MRSKRFAIFILIIFGLSTYIFINNKQSESSPSKTVIYTRTISENRSDKRSRTYPTKEIVLIKEGEKSKVLTTVGKIGEYPYNVEITPDKNNLIINLESKLQILNIKTKKLSDLFIPKIKVESYAFSPDDKELLIWDHQRVGDDGNYYIHALNIENKESKIIKQGVSKESYIVDKWRSDGIILLRQAQGWVSPTFYFDLHTNKIEEPPLSLYWQKIVSEDGYLKGIISNEIDDICNEYSGSAPNEYRIIEPISIDIKGIIKDEKNYLYLNRFSPDNSHVLYSIYKPNTTKDDCEKQKEKVGDFVYNIDTKNSIEVLDIHHLLESWDSNYVNANVEYDYDKRLWSLYINNQLIEQSSMDIDLIGTYLK